MEWLNWKNLLAAWGLLRSQGGLILLIAVAGAFPLTLRALHRAPKVPWRFGFSEIVNGIVSLGALVLYLALLGAGVWIWRTQQ